MAPAASGFFEERFLIFVSSTPLAQLPNYPFATPESWAAGVRADLLFISQTRVGALLLRSIRSHSRVVFIEPHAQGLWYCNAITGPEDLIGARVQYNPGHLGPGSQCAQRDVAVGGYANQSNETLLHELVHALRWVSGKNHTKAVSGGLSFYDNKEEFIAVLTQGIYASELKRPIRSSHFLHFEIDKELEGSFDFFKTGADTYKYVKAFCHENPFFTRGLADIDVPFNPIRAYYLKPAQAKAYSHSHTARRRDHLMPIVKAAKEYLREFFE